MENFSYRLFSESSSLYFHRYNTVVIPFLPICNGIARRSFQIKRQSSECHDIYELLGKVQFTAKFSRSIIERKRMMEAMKWKRMNSMNYRSKFLNNLKFRNIPYFWIFKNRPYFWTYRNGPQFQLTCDNLPLRQQKRQRYSQLVWLLRHKGGLQTCEQLNWQKMLHVI